MSTKGRQPSINRVVERFQKLVTHGLSDTLDIVTKNLAVTLGTTPDDAASEMPSTHSEPSNLGTQHSLSETLSAFAASRHVST